MIDFPASPTVGQNFAAPNGVTYQWNGTVWVSVSAGGSSGASITISDTPPGSPVAGALWWNSVLGVLMIYFNDGNTSQWVPSVPTASGVGPFLPLTGGTLTGPLTGTAATFNGDVRANDYFIVSSAPTDAGSFGFGNANGPNIQMWGSSTGQTGALYLQTNNVTRMSISGAGSLAMFGPLAVFGSGQAASNPSTSTGLGGSIYLQDSGAGVGNGGMAMFGANQGAFAAIKGYATNGSSNTQGDLIIATRRNATDATLTDTVQIGSSGTTTFAGLVVGTTLQLNKDPTTGWLIDGSNNSITVANGSSGALFGASGILMLANPTNGDIGLYIVGGGSTVLLGSTSATWVASTATPAAGKASVAYDGAGHYRIYNNFGSSQAFLVTTIMARASV